MKKWLHLFSMGAIGLLGGVILWVSGIIRTEAQNPESLVAEGANVEKLASGFYFTEGPAISPQGDLFFTDIPANRIYKWLIKERTLSLTRENSGGANGLFFDQAGNLIACEGNSRHITSMAPDGTVTVIADRFDGKRFNKPNDLWVDPKGGIYFTDPAYDRRKEELDVDVDGVYYIWPDRQGIIQVSDDLYRPNGIIGSADGSLLYVSELSGRKTWIYQIRLDGTLADKKLLVAAGSDGMTMDSLKNVYLTNQDKGSVDIYSSSGQLLESIRIPETPANVTFGGMDKKTLFITANTSLYSLAMRVAGQ